MEHPYKIGSDREFIEVLKSANKKLADFAREKQALAETHAAAGHRLALELECLLMDTKDMAAVSKWWDSAHEALEAWHALDGQPHVSPLGMD